MDWKQIRCKRGVTLSFPRNFLAVLVYGACIHISFWWHWFYFLCFHIWWHRLKMLPYVVVLVLLLMLQYLVALVLLLMLQYLVALVLILIGASIFGGTGFVIVWWYQVYYWCFHITLGVPWHELKRALISKAIQEVNCKMSLSAGLGALGSVSGN